MVDAKGIKTPAYYSAFAHMRKQCRENGIDAALNPIINGKKTSLDALLFCDVRGAGQQIAAQACKSLFLSFPFAKNEYRTKNNSQHTLL